MCEDSASFDLTSHDLAQCIGDIGHILDLKKKGETYLEKGTYISILNKIILFLFYYYEVSVPLKFLTVHTVL